MPKVLLQFPGSVSIFDFHCVGYEAGSVFLLLIFYSALPPSKICLARRLSPLCLFRMSSIVWTLICRRFIINSPFNNRDYLPIGTLCN